MSGRQRHRSRTSADDRIIDVDAHHSLVPVLLGSGVRLFDERQAAPILLDGPDLLVEGSRVTHLRYQVRRS